RRPYRRTDAPPRARDRRADRPEHRRARPVPFGPRGGGVGMTATVQTDTVELAVATPEVAQPYRELGLKDDEYARIREILGRRPTDAQLGMDSGRGVGHSSYNS